MTNGADGFTNAEGRVAIVTGATVRIPLSVYELPEASC